jgi:hypothetical protein
LAPLDTDVNDDGLTDLLGIPTRPCGLMSITPPPRDHLPHLNLEPPPNTTRCPGSATLIAHDV